MDQSKIELTVSGTKNGFDRYIGKIQTYFDGLVDVELYRRWDNKWILARVDNGNLFAKQKESKNFNCPSETSIFAYDGED